MKKKLISFIIISLITFSFVFTISPQPSRAGPPAFYCWSNGPWEAWEGDTIEFVASGYGGYTPYQWRWDFGDGSSTDWSYNNTEEHAYNNIQGSQTSATTFTVTLYGKDSADPPHQDTSVSYAYVYKDFDLKASVEAPLIIFEEDRVNFDCEAINDNWDYRYVVPDEVNDIDSWIGRCTLYQWNGEEYEYLMHDDHEPYNPLDYDIDWGNKDDWETPTWIPTQKGWYKVKLEIISSHDEVPSNDIDEEEFYVFEKLD